jgi:hypothetical protein
MAVKVSQIEGYSLRKLPLLKDVIMPAGGKALIKVDGDYLHYSARSFLASEDSWMRIGDIEEVTILSQPSYFVLFIGLIPTFAAIQSLFTSLGASAFFSIISLIFFLVAFLLKVSTISIKTRSFTVDIIIKGNIDQYVDFGKNLLSVRVGNK